MIVTYKLNLSYHWFIKISQTGKELEQEFCEFGHEHHQKNASKSLKNYKNKIK